MQQRQSSCLTCRTRKVKCDKKIPACSRCLKTNNNSCVYPRQGTLGRPPKNACLHGKGRNNSARKLIIREFIFENVGEHQNNSSSSSLASSSPTPSVTAITSGFYVNSEWWILSKEAIQEHHYLNTYFQTIYSFYVIRGLYIRERFDTVTYRLPEKPRLKFNNLQLLHTWWVSLSANLLIKRASQIQLETYSVPSLTLYMFQMIDKSNTTTTMNDENGQSEGQQQQTASSSPGTPSTTLSSSLSISLPSTPSPPSSSVPIYPKTHHHPNLSDPLRSLPSEQAINLINDFFLVHPHSILINRSKLMKDYWADTANPLLLSVIYGTTQCFSQLLQGIPVFLWGSGTENNRNPFLTYAHSLLETLPTSPSTSDYQASVMLALFEIVWGYPKMGMSLLATTYLMGTQLGLWDKTFKATDAIEEELVNMTFWSVFRATTHGCIEMGASIVDSLVCHQRSFPPMNIYESESYQHDTLHNFSVTSRQAYLTESFYSGAVVTHYSGILFACLPKPYVNVYGIKTEDSTFEGSELLTMLRSIKDVETRVHMVLDDFKQFIQQQRRKWTTIQLYTIETSYRLYRIHFRFLQSTHTCGKRKYQEDLIPAPAIDEDNNTRGGCHFNFMANPADHGNAVRLQQVLDDLLPMVDELEAILTEDTTTPNDFKSMDRTTLLPYDLMVTVYETSVQLLIVNYQLDPSQRIYDTMAKLLTIAKLQDTYQPPSAAMKNVRQRLKLFMKHHHHTPPADATTTTTSIKEQGDHLSTQHSSPPLPSLPPQSNRTDDDVIYNNEAETIDLNLDIQPFYLHPLMQQQQQNYQYQLIGDPTWSVSSSSLPSQLSPFIPYFYQHQQQQQQQQQQLLAASSPMASSSSSSSSLSSSSHLPQYSDTHAAMTEPITELQQKCKDNNQVSTVIGPSVMWDDPSSFIDWDNMMTQTLHPYGAPFSFFDQEHQDLGNIPF
ncbi:hypothetical protein BCR42DRAFT_426857 [Absidia repens]|uniref:Zn(2)-C6 fungal-type domain-containing protein n=1 Tax=Absidia repens TaxID=90262 RepID=A0A1X2I0D5_9FUNG|nr:hypothetical protein BCR42DRAFT_426857 [Absidia repens]